jgi:hypothetical protein
MKLVGSVIQLSFRRAATLLSLFGGGGQKKQEPDIKE